MHEVRSLPLLRATDQLLRFTICACCTAVGASLACIAAPIALAFAAEGIALAIFTVGALLLLVPTLIALRTIKCPNCGALWLQDALGGRPVGNWVAWILTFRECPRCKYTAASIVAAPPSNKSLERTREG